MGFEQQTEGQPLVNIHKRTTKVNITMVIGVAVFLLVGVCVVIWAYRKEARGEPVHVEQAEPPK